MSGRISFIGAGPGAADLITIRAARRIAAADVVVWSASVLAPECVREHARPDAELVDSSQLTHEQAVEIFRRAERDRLAVVRLHAGDPALWGAVQDQYDAAAKMELEVEIVPGVSGATAAAAAVGRELTRSAQSVLLTRLAADSPESSQVREFARDGVTLAVQLPAARAAQLVEELRAGGHDDDVPVLVAYKVSQPDELLVRTTVGELEQAVKSRKLWRNALFLVGKALAPSSRPRGYQRESGYRGGDAPARRRSYRSSRRRSAARADDPDELPQPRPVAEPAPVPAADVPSAGQAKTAVPNIAWWAVREWQEEARSSARTRPRRAADPAQSELFAETGAETEQAGAEVSARPELSVVRDAENPAVERSSAATGTAEIGAAGAAAHSAASEEASAAAGQAEQTASSGRSADAGNSARNAPQARNSGQTRNAAQQATTAAEAAENSGNSAGSGKARRSTTSKTGTTGNAAQPETAAEPEAPANSGTSANTGAPADSGSPTDSGTPADSATPADAATPADPDAEQDSQAQPRETARAGTSAARTSTSRATAKTTRSRTKAQTKAQKTTKSATRSKTTKRKDTTD